jgi:hypothetical protein
MLFFDVLGKQKISVGEGKKVNKVNAGILFIIMLVQVAGLFSTLVTLSSRVPLTLFYSAYRPRVVNLNLYLEYHLGFAATLTPGYYVMPQYLTNSIAEVTLYAYVARDALKMLFRTDLIVWDTPCQGVCYQLQSAGLYDLNSQELFTSLLHTYNLVYNDAQLEVLTKGM